VIKSQNQALTGPRFCLFSSYGNPTTGAPVYPEATTPPVLGFSQRVPLTVSSNSAAPDICLFYSLPEYQDFLSRFHQRLGIEFTLNTEVQNYVLSHTNGHPGMIESILSYICNVCETKPSADFNEGILLTDSVVSPIPFETTQYLGDHSERDIGGFMSRLPL
jgi:hypothetical protein